MPYRIIKYVAEKPLGYHGERLVASPEVQFTRDDKSQAELMLEKLYEVSSNQRTMQILKRTRYTFRCETKLRKYLFKICHDKERLLDKIAI